MTTIPSVTTLRIPDPRLGLNSFATDAWWEATPDAERTPDARVVAAPGAPWDGERTLLVAGAVTDHLAEPTVAAVEAWAAEVCALVAAQPGPVHLAVSLSTVRSLDEAVTLAQGRRWPAYDAVEAARHRAGEPVPVPSIPGGQQAVSAFVTALLPQVEVLAASGWATAADATADATACVSRSLDADPDVPDDLARELRAAGRAALVAFEEAGLTISGPRDALLWPVSAERGQIPIEVAADAAVEAMLALRERPAVEVAR